MLRAPAAPAEKYLHMLAAVGADPTDGYELVTSTMQRTLTRLSNERSLPILG